MPLPPQISGVSQLDPRDPEFAVKAIDQLLPCAIKMGASDLHLQPRREGWDLFVRVDGVLQFLVTLPGGGESDPVTRLMVLAQLPTYRSGQPMEGRLKWGDDSQVSMRLSVFPTVHGPRAAIRFLGKGSQYDSIASLGLPEDLTESITQLSEQTDGAILLAGPAGSGKTTTLYAILRRIAAQPPRRSVLTIEDPVESVIDTISQSELDPVGA